MFKKILVPVDIDYPKTAALVYQRAAEIGASTNADIHLISVMPGYSMPIVASFVSDAMVKEAKTNLKDALEAFIKENCKEATSFTIKVGKNWDQITQEADKWGADLIVVYHNRRREENEAFSNSCSQRVMENANCSVLRLRNIRD